jgi:hypothetical protein
MVSEPTRSLSRHRSLPTVDLQPAKLPLLIDTEYSSETWFDPRWNPIQAKKAQLWQIYCPLSETETDEHYDDDQAGDADHGGVGEHS